MVPLSADGQGSEILSRELPFATVQDKELSRVMKVGCGTKAFNKLVLRLPMSMDLHHAEWSQARKVLSTLLLRFLIALAFRGLGKGWEVPKIACWQWFTVF